MYEAKKLGYSYNALEPIINAEIVNIQYNKYYKVYVDNFNKLVPNYQGSITAIINNIDNYQLNNRDNILFYAGGIINHELYFTILSNKKNNRPTGALKEAIDKKYGSFDQFKNTFINEANKLVGSGWTFLVLDSNKNLNIINTSNEDTPYFYNMKPIIALDLWEHAYYLQYQNRRSDYINAFFDILDFKVISEIYNQALR
jgi:Fe-Mn family superoxide dismutase